MTVNYATSIAVNNDLLVIQANAFDPLFSSLDEEDARRIEAIPGVASVEPGIYAWIATEDMPFFLIFGYEPGSQAASHYRIVEGKPVTGAKQIAIGRRAAESLKKEVDDTVRLYGVPYHIVGIYETGQAMEEAGGLGTPEEAPDLDAKTWYGFPSYARDGEVMMFLQPAAKFDTRYATIGFNGSAALDDGDMWPTSYAVVAMNEQVAARIAELVRRAAA